MFGIQPEPTWGELLAFAVYAIPMTYLRLPSAAASQGAGGVDPPRRSPRPSKPSDHHFPRRIRTDVPNHWSRAARSQPLSGTVARRRPGRYRGRQDGGGEGHDQRRGLPGEAHRQGGPEQLHGHQQGHGRRQRVRDRSSGDRILGEVENIAPGPTSEFTLTLKAGNYKTACPGGSRRQGQARREGHRRHQALAPTARPRSTSTASTSITQTAALTAATKTFTDAVDSGDLAAAKAAYPAARIPYEAIEPVAEAFGDLDPKIDAREGDVPKKDWGGYHFIEKALWVDGTDRRSVASTPPTSTQRADAPEPGAGRRAAAGRHRQRRGRAAQRGVEVEDHR